MLAENLYLDRTPLEYTQPLTPAKLDARVDPEWVLGREMKDGKQYAETHWVEAHEELLEVLRGEADENAGYSYLRNGALCTGRISFPFWGADQKYRDMELVQFVRDAPYTTIVSSGENTIPLSQERRLAIANEKMKNVKNVIFVVGGLLENRLVVEGMGVDIFNALENPEETAVVCLSHSGAEQSYRADCDLTQITPEIELATIDASIKRILSLYGLTRDQVLGLVGHSKGGYFVEKLLQSGEYTNAAGVELAPVVMGTRVAKKMEKWPPWLLSHAWKLEQEGLNTPHVIVQQGIYNTLINLALYSPDMAIRDAAIKFVAPSVAAHFVGETAAYFNEAVYGISHEILKNKEAIKAQQRSLTRMGAIVDNMETISSNARLVIAAGLDVTLSFIHQWIYKWAIITRQTSPGKAIVAAADGKNSPHNTTQIVIDKMAIWVANYVKRHMTKNIPPSTHPVADFKLTDTLEFHTEQ